MENFALALAGESKDDFAESLLSEAQYNLYKDIVRQWRFKAKQELFKELGNKEPTEAQVVERCIENYGEEFIEAFELVGKKDKRKRNHSKNTAGAPNGNNGDESATACVNNSKGPAKATTPVSTPTAISTSGPRQAENAQAEAGAPSCGGSAANHFAHEALDSLSDKASDQAASNTGITPPVVSRESGNLEATTKKPNGGGADAANRKTAEDCKSATSAQPLRPWKEVVEKSLGMTGNDKRPAGGSTPSSSSLVPPAGTVDVLSLAYSGEFQNVKLTQEQYAELGIRFGNQQKLNRAIDSLSCKLENEEIKPRNHYAELLKWANYRDDKEEEAENAQPKQRYMTSAEISERNALIGWKKLKESQARRVAK